MSSDGSDDDDAELTHEQAVELLDAWRDGELSGKEAERVEAHLESCARCRAVESALGGGLRSALTKAAAAEQKDLLPGVQRKLRLRSRGRFYGGDGERSATPSPWPLMIGSVAILAILVVLYVMIGQVASTPSPSPTPSVSASAPPR